MNEVTIINPGTLSKKKAAGTYAKVALKEREITEEEQEYERLRHKVYERARVEIVKI